MCISNISFSVEVCARRPLVLSCYSFSYLALASATRPFFTDIPLFHLPRHLQDEGESVELDEGEEGEDEGDVPDPPFIPPPSAPPPRAPPPPPSPSPPPPLPPPSTPPPSPPPPLPPPPAFEAHGFGACKYVFLSGYSKVRIAAPDGCGGCFKVCLDGLPDWYVTNNGKRSHATCHALECSASSAFCVLYDTVPDAKSQSSDHSAGSLSCYRRSPALPWTQEEAPSPPMPPLPPPPPAPIAPLACHGRVTLNFPDAAPLLKSAIAGTETRGLPTAFLEGRPRCDDRGHAYYEGIYSLDSSSRLAGVAPLDGSSRGLLVGGKGGSSSSYLWWRPAANWSNNGWYDDPQNEGGWVLTDEPPLLSPSTNGRHKDRLLPPDEQPLAHERRSIT